MTGRILIVIVCCFALGVHAQQASTENINRNSSTSPVQPSDELLRHLAAAENHQISGDLINAAVENRAVLGIALERSGIIAIEEGKYTDAVDYFTKSLDYSDTASCRTNLAIAHLRQNHFEKALAEAQNAVLIDPKHIGARYILGNIFYTQENYEAARPELEMVFEEAPDFEIARALGLTYLNLKQPELARKHFEKVKSTAKTETADFHTLLAKFYEKTNYPTDAERELRLALAVEPFKPRLNFYLGYLLLQNAGSERMREAWDAFGNELKLNPNDFYSLFFSGVVASSLNENEKAIPLLEKAIQINAKSGEAHLFLAQSQIELGDLVNAEKNLRRAIELESTTEKNTQARRTHFVFGRLLLKIGKKEEGMKELAIAGELQKAALDSSRNEINRILGQVAEDSELKSGAESSIGPSTDINLTPERLAQIEKIKTFLMNVLAQSFNNLGVISTQRSQFGDAILHFTDAFKWNPDFPNLSRNLGIVSFQAGEYEKALQPLERQLKTNPQDILIRKMLGASYYFTKDFSKSVDKLKPIEDELTSDSELSYFYGISLVQLKRNLEASQVFAAIAGNSQEKPAELFYAAQGFMIAGNYARAIQEFRRVVLLAPQTSKANYFVGQCQIRLNNLVEAEKSFTRELEINPGDALSKYHLALTLIERKIDTERAVRNLEDAISLRYNYADAFYQLGKISLEKGENGKAITLLESAASADASKDYIHYQLSIAYRKASRKEDADRELKLYKKLKDEKRKTDNPMPMGVNDDIFDN